mmetsp:Transcript_13194/g.9550  ORF Transcript_13194/g.9550 Transcript_13194/m.9550 type:complete len:97 (+) Transcript_13194:223-513(+)
MAVISWKWVAKRQKHWISVAMYSAIAHAKPNPSFVDVPRPNSSIIIKLFLVAVLSMQEASSISAMKVEMPLSWWSEAPTLAMMQSTIGISAFEQGT